jgi:hypothetical protein
MRWYNPTTRVAESVLAPYTDKEAEEMGVEQAITFVGHLLGMRHPRHQPVG